MKLGRLTVLAMALSLLGTLAIPGTANAAVTICSQWQSLVHGPNNSAHARVCITREAAGPGSSYLRGQLVISNQSNLALYVAQTTVIVDPQINPPVPTGPRWISPKTTDTTATLWYVDVTPQADYAMAQVKYWRSDVMQYTVLTLWSPQLV